MGTNKALLRLDPAGPTVVESVVQTLRQVTGDIVLVGAEAGAYAFLDLPWLPDQYPGAGPLAGIQAALTGAQADHVLVVACDMPFLNADLLQFMASEVGHHHALIPEIGQMQPLHAIYAQSCLPAIEYHLAAGRYRVTGWLDDINVQIIDQSLVERFDPTLRSCFNLNTLEDLERAREVSQ